MADSVLQRQLDEIRVLLVRARELFGASPIQPHVDIATAPVAAKTWLS